jgi:hypothetical protein
MVAEKGADIIKARHPELYKWARDAVIVSSSGRIQANVRVYLGAVS